jgi:hypothetical protein
MSQHEAKQIGIQYPVVTPIRGKDEEIRHEH